MVNEEGNVLIVTLIFTLVSALLVSTLLALVNNNVVFTRMTNDSARAFYIAESGARRAVSELTSDYRNDSTPAWDDGDINGIACGPDATKFYPFPVTNTNVGGGSYAVWLRNVPGEGDQIWVMSTGTYNARSRTIELYVEARDFGYWQNCIFAGVGATGWAVRGNVDIRGSVHILGNGLTDADMAMNLSGTAKIGNNYKNIAGALADRIPDCPVVMYNGEVIESLGAEVRVKQGLVGLDGTGTAGEIDVSGNLYKETMDGIYVTDGYTGNQGEKNIYSDNGKTCVYDLGDEITFPRLNDPYKGYLTYQDYLSDNALVISDPAALSDFSSITPGTSFSYTDPGGKGSIAMDGSGNLSISGIVYLDGGALAMNKAVTGSTITYTGKGTIFATGGAQINLNLVSEGMDSFPANVLGIMTSGDITFNSASTNIMGAFYAENSVVALKQVNLAGTFVSNYFDMGTQVPSIFGVPALAENLPPGMIGSEPIWVVRVIAWREI